MDVSWPKKAFVYAAAGLMVLATQSQSCSASGGNDGENAPNGPNGTGAVGGGTPYDGGGAEPNPFETRVAIVQSSQLTAAAITDADVDLMVQQAVDLAGGFAGLIQDGQTVVLKPNLVQPHDFTGGPNWQAGPYLTPQANGVSTDYRVTRAVARLVRQHNPNGIIYVMEGTAGDGPTGITSTDQVFQILNYTPTHIPEVNAFLAIEADSALPGGYQMVTVANGLLGNSYAVNTKYLNAHVVISLPTMKTHIQAVVTGGVKNVGIGATPASVYGRPDYPSAQNPNPLLRMATVDHTSIALHHFIHDFYLARPVNFVVMDGLQGIQNGPVPSTAVSGATNIAQDQMNMRLILAGADAVAVDAIESMIMGWDPQRVEHLQALHNTGAGTMETANIRVVGTRVDLVRKPFAVPPTEFAFGGQQITDAMPPTMAIVGAPQVLNGMLNLALQADADLRKVEVYLNTQLIEPTVIAPTLSVPTSAISMDVSHLPLGTYNLDILGYDYYLNATLQSLPGAVVIQ